MLKPIPLVTGKHHQTSYISPQFSIYHMAFFQCSSEVIFITRVSQYQALDHYSDVLKGRCCGWVVTIVRLKYFTVLPYSLGTAWIGSWGAISWSLVTKEKEGDIVVW